MMWLAASRPSPCIRLHAVPEAPANTSFAMRRVLFWLAWLLLALSLALPAPDGSIGAHIIGGSAFHVYDQAMTWNAAVPGSADDLGFGRSALLALALYSNVVFIIMPYMLRVRSVAATCKVFLLVALAVDASVVFVVPEFSRLPAYWIWLASIAAITAAFVVGGGDASTPATKPRRTEATVDRGEMSPFVWVLLGITLFWIAVSAGNHANPPADSLALATRAPLTAYVNDRARLLGADEASQLDFTLQGFEAKTPDQIVVAMYPRAPAGAIDEFTIRTAERSRIGRGGIDTGAILFVFMEERVARLEVGYGLEGILTDARAHRLLETALVPAFARGAYFDGLDRMVNSMFVTIQDAYRRDGAPDALQVWKRKLDVARPGRLSSFWQAVRNVGLVARVGITFLLAFVGLILWSTIPQWWRLLRDLARGAGNLMARRPFRDGMEAVDGATLRDSLRLLFWTVGLLLPAAGAIIIAGGGAFGGGGALIHW